MHCDRHLDIIAIDNDTTIDDRQLDSIFAVGDVLIKSIFDLFVHPEQCCYTFSYCLYVNGVEDVLGKSENTPVTLDGLREIKLESVYVRWSDHVLGLSCVVAVQYEAIGTLLVTRAWRRRG